MAFCVVALFSTWRSFSGALSGYPSINTLHHLFNTVNLLIIVSVISVSTENKVDLLTWQYSIVCRGKLLINEYEIRALHYWYNSESIHVAFVSC